MKGKGLEKVAGATLGTGAGLKVGGSQDKLGRDSGWSGVGSDELGRSQDEQMGPGCTSTEVRPSMG